jgi:hypothetical protein
MPAKYEAIRNSLLRRGKSEKEAKSTAAAVYVSQGKTKYARSQRAKSLQHKRKYR